MASGRQVNAPRASAGVVTALAGSGLFIPSESWANPTTQTLPLVPDTFSALLALKLDVISDAWISVVLLRLGRPDIAVCK